MPFARETLLIFSGFILFAFYTPVTLIWLNVIPFRYRFFLAFIVMAVTIPYILKRGFNWSELGFRRDTLKGSLKWNLGVSSFFLVLVYGFYYAGWIEPAQVRLWPIFLIAYVLVLTPVQEFFFRSILFAEMEKVRVRTPLPIIALSSLSYGFLHVIYQKPAMLVATLLMGVVWGCIYYKYPNFWGVTISHALVGAVAITVGMI
jgi:membrane protease YdiL (CAAX protease family)